MTKQELQDFISKLEPAVSKDTALFEIYQYGGGPDESFIKANPDGLQLFAIELLNASLRVEETIKDSAKNTIDIEHEKMLQNGDIGIHYIELTLEERQTALERLPDKQTWKDTLTKGGCISIAVVLVIATIVGLISILKWLF
ncbi:MAG TPA: hypothetical protein VMR70_01880 [Flavisolibacter sp.]|nr:hypothetical protein [Flavisolibacter sp.]